MYATCPKCGYQAEANAAIPDICPDCGLIYSKWLKSLASDPEFSEPSALSASTASSASFLSTVSKFFVRTRPNVNRADVFGYSLIWMLMVWWGFEFLAMDVQSAEIMNNWFHNVNLIFHEAGHIFFMPLGTWMMFLGGSAFQVLLPLGLMFAFLVVNRDAFAGSACLWWTGQSMLDVAPYIADARALRLPLLGGGTGRDSPGTHDWANLLRPLGMLNEDLRMAAIADVIGSGLILIALIWGAYMLRVYYRAAIN